MNTSLCRSAAIFLSIFLALTVSGTIALGHAPAKMPAAATPAMAAAGAEEPQEPKSVVMHRALTLLRDNPAGLQSEHRLLWRMDLSDSDHILFRDTYLAIGPQLMVSPSLQRLGARIDFKPLAMLELFALAEYLWFLGNFDYVTSYDDASADHSPKALEVAGDTGGNYSATGLSLAVSARLQVKVKDLAIRSTTRMNRYWMDTKDGDPVWYDIYWDIMSSRRGWTMLQDNDLLYVKDRLVIGLRHTWTRSWLPDSAMAAVPEGAPRPDSIHRLGPLVAWRLVDEPKYADTAFRRPTLLLLSQFWLAHPYRAGQQVSQFRPWLVIALAFDGRLYGQ